ncbi:MAG: hypothetical protein JWP97_3543 [Labilithrix sp.]|nr:hypothetical protein [Labilithrix sp.]
MPKEPAFWSLLERACYLWYGMEAALSADRIVCPSCGGAGGGPFGRAGSAWDDEDYVCPRCKGVGALLASEAGGAGGSGGPQRAGEVVRPGIVKVSPDVAPAREGDGAAAAKRKASA